MPELQSLLAMVLSTMPVPSTAIFMGSPFWLLGGQGIAVGKQSDAFLSCCSG
jgi:hypothetical protein